MNPPNAILHELLNLAEIMLTNGAEVSRVEETLNRMGHAYGATQMNVFAKMCIRDSSYTERPAKERACSSKFFGSVIPNSSISS